MKKYTKQDLYVAYNATSTDDGTGSDEIETYENWLERQLISRIERIDELEKQFKVGAYRPIADNTTTPPKAIPSEPINTKCTFRIQNECNYRGVHPCTDKTCDLNANIDTEIKD